MHRSRVPAMQYHCCVVDWQCRARALTSGFHNIPVVHHQRCKLGLVTHDGLFRFCCMVVGLKNSPAWFQYVVNHVLLTAGVDAAAAFVDDLTVGGDLNDWQTVW